MKTLALLVLYFCLGVSAFGSDEELIWKAAGFTQPEIHRYELLADSILSGVVTTHEFEATLVVFRGAGWSEAQVLERARKTARIYATCGIAMRAVKLVITGIPYSDLDIGWSNGRDRQIAEITPVTAHPIVYFARQDLDGYYAYSWRKSNTKIEVLKDTSWMSRALEEDEEFKNSVDASYEVLAHEIGHLMGDSGHLDDGTKNLMAEDLELINGSLNAEQCARFKSSSLVSAIAK